MLAAGMLLAHLEMVGMCTIVQELSINRQPSMHDLVGRLPLFLQSL